MTLDDVILAEVQAARTRAESLEDEAYEARARLHQAMRRLHGAGGSMREIATALGMSHQRVHQIIGEEAIVEVEATSTEIAPFPTGAALTVTDAQDACSFCSAPRREVATLFAAPGGVFVCNGCVAGSRVVLSGGSSRDLVVHLVPTTEDATCSFCRNSSAAVGAMVEHDEFGTRICGQCIATCERLLKRSEPPTKTMRRRNTKVRCSFCNISQVDCQKLIAGPGIYICNECVGAASTVAETRQQTRGPRAAILQDATKEDHTCGFCGKHPSAVEAVVKGGRTRICNECLNLCHDILHEEGVPSS